MKFSVAVLLGAVAPFVASQSSNIPETAIAAGSFETLVAALSAADLVDALSAAGPFTVFAPSDDAFAALPEDLVPCLVKPENVDILSSILTYHVAAGQVLSTDLVDGMMIKTLNDEATDLIVSISEEGGVMINNATVTTADILTTNGVIHVVDSVIVPPGLDVAGFLATCESEEPVVLPELDIPQTAIDAGSFQTLVTALTAADLVGALSAPAGPYTVFAPSDDAFAALPEGLVPCLVKPENVGVLGSILTYHVAEGQVLSTDLSDGMMIPTLNTDAEDLTITVSEEDGVMINDATVIIPDILALNGVIHVVDSVIVPPDLDVAGFLATCEMDEEPVVLPELDIPATAIAAGTFQTLVAALTAADLVGALSTPAGPFTVFAPADDAFAALPEELVMCLLKPENFDVLSAILTYHVVEGEVLSTDLTDGMTAPTLQGEDVTVDLTDGVKINNVPVVTPDIGTSNGVIHVIGSVLVPPSIDVDAFLESCTSSTMSESSSVPVVQGTSPPAPAPATTDPPAPTDESGAFKLDKLTTTMAASVVAVFMVLF